MSSIIALPLGDMLTIEQRPFYLIDGFKLIGCPRSKFLIVEDCLYMVEGILMEELPFGFGLFEH